MTYPWHPAFDTDVDVLYEEKRRGEVVYVCLLPNDSGAVIPKWMFNDGKCSEMQVAESRASLPALIEVRAILTELGFHGSDVAAGRRDEEGASAKKDQESSSAVVAVATHAEPKPHRRARAQGARKRRSTAGAPAERGGGEEGKEAIR